MECPVCTYHNVIGATVCEVCETQLPVSSDSTSGSGDGGGSADVSAASTSEPSQRFNLDQTFASPPSVAQPREWPCTVCTFLNRISSSRCAVCSVGERPPQSSSERVRRSGSRFDEDEDRSSPSSSNVALMIESLSVGNPLGPFGYPKTDSTNWFSDWEVWSVDPVSRGGSHSTQSSSISEQEVSHDTCLSNATASSVERLGKLFLPSLLNLASSSSALTAISSQLSHSSPVPLSQGGAFSDAAGRAALRLAAALAWRQAARQTQSPVFSSLRTAESTAHVLAAALCSNLAVDVSLSVDLIRLLLIIDHEKSKDGMNSVRSSQIVFAKNLLALGAAHSILGLTVLAVAASRNNDIVYDDDNNKNNNDAKFSSLTNSKRSSHASEFAKALVEATMAITVAFVMDKDNGSRLLPHSLLSTEKFKEFILIPFASSFHSNGRSLSSEAKDVLNVFLSDSLRTLKSIANSMQNVSTIDSLKEICSIISPNMTLSVYELEVSGVVDAFCNFYDAHVSVNSTNGAKRFAEVLSSMGPVGLSLVTALQGRVGRLSSSIFRGDIAAEFVQEKCVGCSAIVEALFNYNETLIRYEVSQDSSCQDEDELISISKCVHDLAKARTLSVVSFLARPSKDAWNNLQGTTRLRGEGAVDVNVTLSSIKDISLTESSPSLSKDLALRVLLCLSNVPASALSATTAPITGTFGPGVASIINVLPSQKMSRTPAPSSANVRARANPSFGRIVMSMQQPIAVRLVPNLSDPVFQLIGLVPIAVCTDAPSLPPVEISAFPSVLSPSSFSSKVNNGVDEGLLTDLLPPFLTDVDTIVSASNAHQNETNASSLINKVLHNKSTSVGPIEKSSVTSNIRNSVPSSTSSSTLLLAHSGTQLVVPVRGSTPTQYLKLLDSTVSTALWVDPLLSLVEVHSSVLSSVQSDLNTLRSNIATQAMAVQVEILTIVKDVQTARVGEKSKTLSPAAASGITSPRAGSGAICKYYGKAGGCKFGSSCRFVHIGPGGVIVEGGGVGSSRVSNSSFNDPARSPPIPPVIPTVSGISQVFESLDQEVEECTKILFANRSEATVAMANWNEEHLPARNEVANSLRSSETPEIAPNTARVGSSGVHSYRGFGQRDEATNEEDGVQRDFREEQNEGDDENDEEEEVDEEDENEEDDGDGNNDDDDGNDDNDDDQRERLRIRSLLNSALANRSTLSHLATQVSSRELAASEEFAEHAAALFSGLRGDRASAAAAAAAAAALSSAGAGVGGLGAAFSASLLSGGIFGGLHGYGRAHGGAVHGRGASGSEDILYSKITQERTLEERYQTGEFPVSSPADFESYYKGLTQGGSTSDLPLLDLYSPPEEDPLQFVLRLVEEAGSSFAVGSVAPSAGLNLVRSDQPIVGHSNGFGYRKGVQGLMSYWLPPSPADKHVNNIVETILENSYRESDDSIGGGVRGGEGIGGSVLRMFGSTSSSSSYPWMLNNDDRIAFKATAVQTEHSPAHAPWVTPRKSRPMRVFRHSSGVSNSTARQSILESITNINEADAPRHAQQGTSFSSYIRESLMVSSSSSPTLNYVPAFPALSDAIASLRKPDAPTPVQAVYRNGLSGANQPFSKIQNHSFYVAKYCELRNDILDARTAFSSLQRQGQTGIDDPAWKQLVETVRLMNDKRLSHTMKLEKSKQLAASVNNEEECLRRINDLREQLRSLRFLHEASRAVAVRGLWFAVHIANGETQESSFAVCVWGAQMGDFTLLEKLACELSANPNEVHSAAKKLNDLLSSPDSIHSNSTKTSSSTSPWERVHRISFGTLGPLPMQRPPETLLVKNIHMPQAHDRIPVIVDSVSTSGHLHPQSALPALTSIIRVNSEDQSDELLSNKTSISASVTRDYRENVNILSSNLLSESNQSTADSSIQLKPSTFSRFLPAQVIHSLYSASSLWLSEESSSIAKIAATTEFGEGLTDAKKLNESHIPDIKSTGLLELSRVLSLTSHSVCAALASVLTDPLSVFAHTAALSSGRGKPSWPSILVLLIEAPHLTPVSLRQAYFELCGFGLIRSMQDFETRWRGRARALALSDQSHVPEATTSPNGSHSFTINPSSSSSALAFLEARVIGVESVSSSGIQGGTGGPWSIGISSSLASSSMLLDVPPGEYPPEYPQSLKEFGISSDVKRARVMRSHIQEGAMLMVGPHSSATYREFVDNGMETIVDGASTDDDELPLGCISVQPIAPSLKNHVANAFERSKRTLSSLVIPRPQSPPSSTIASSNRHSITRRFPRTSSEVSAPASLSSTPSSLQPRLNREEAESAEDTVQAQAAIGSPESAESELPPTSSSSSLLSSTSSSSSSSSSPAPPPPPPPSSSTGGQRSSVSIYDFPLHSSLSILYTGADGQEEASEAVGTGPTKEFYTLVCREIQRKELKLWIDSDSNNSSNVSPVPLQTPSGVLEGFVQGVNETGMSINKYVVALNGLHPRPLIVPPTLVRVKESSLRSTQASINKHQYLTVPVRHTSWSAGVAHQFEFLGRFVAKGLLEKKGLDLPLSKAFLKAILLGPSCASNPSTASMSPNTTFSIEDIASFDPSFARSLQQLEDLVRKRDDLIHRLKRAHGEGLHHEISQFSKQLTALWEEVDLACIDFTLPVGISGGKDITLTLLPDQAFYELKEENRFEGVNDTFSDESISRALTMAGIIQCNSHPEWNLSSAVSLYDVSILNEQTLSKASLSSSSRSSVRGSDINVTLSNLHVYLAGVVRTVCVDGVALQRDAFLRGFSSLCPGSCVLRRDAQSGRLESDSILRLFSTNELHELLSGAGSLQDDSLWAANVIEANITVGTHYNARSPQIQWLARAISELTVSERRLFLKFLTGAPRLPPGGFAALQPNRIRIQKMSASDEDVDTRLPAASVCWLEIKVPAYTSFEVLKDRLRVAIYEGNEFFDRT
jgi:hypothetical protein